MGAAEREMTVAWGWVLVGTALSQVIGAPIAAGGDRHRLNNFVLWKQACPSVPCLCSCVEAGITDTHIRQMGTRARSWDILFPGAGLLALDGVGHLHGWQWLFLVEGVLTVLMGIYLAMALASDPSRASALQHLRKA